MFGTFFWASATDFSENDLETAVIGAKRAVNGFSYLRSELNTKLNPGQVRLRPARQRRRSSEQEMKS